MKLYRGYARSVNLHIFLHAPKWALVKSGPRTGVMTWKTQVSNVQHYRASTEPAATAVAAATVWPWWCSYF